MLHACIMGYVHGNRFGEAMRVATKAITASIMETSSSFAPEQAKSGILNLSSMLKEVLHLFLKLPCLKSYSLSSTRKKHLLHSFKVLHYEWVCAVILF